MPLQAELKTLELKEPFKIAHGTSTQRQVLRLHWMGAVGEAPLVPYYLESGPETLRWIEGLSWNGSPAPQEGPRLGRLALDLLWHDAIGRERGAPLWEIWGLDAGAAPPGCCSFGIPGDLIEFAGRVKRAHRQFTVLKVKVGSGDLDFDEAIVATAREAAPTAKLLVDANGGWSVAETAALLPRWVKYDLTLVEQPFHHDGGTEAWRELKYLLPVRPVPVYADESAQMPDDVLRLAGLVDGVNVKLLKCGSLAEARTMIRFARASGMGVLLGCMVESSIGVTAAAHLAPLADWIDLDGHLYLADDDYAGLAYDGTGRLVLPEGPGLGVSLR
jgi:L-alanine-DL-glutamate epimerase-like enolase superfamily enzyme